MLASYLRTALRNLRKRVGYALINVVGLGVGMACCLLVLLFVRDELSYDTFNAHADRLYRVTRSNAANTPYPLGPSLQAEMPEVARAVRIYDDGARGIRSGDQVFLERGFLFADPAIFSVFTFPFVEGGPATALEAPNAVVLTQTAARKYFGEASPMGRTLEVRGLGDLVVTGVIADVPHNAQFRFDVLASFRRIEEISAQYMQSWVINASTYTYVLLKRGARVEGLKARIPAFIEEHTGKPVDEAGGNAQLRLLFQPLTDVHLHAQLLHDFATEGNIRYVYVFSAIALFVLLIACINFMNLTTARSAQRAREIGMRKALGAHRSQIVRQFLGESLLMAFAAMLLALLLAELALPLFNQISGKQLTVDYLNDAGLLAELAGIALFVGLVAGSYPAVFLSGFRPAAVLKGEVVGGRGATRLRHVLVIAQYTVAIALIAGTAIVYNQLRYVQQADLGYDTEQVVSVVLADNPIQPRVAAFRDILQREPTVVDATLASDVPGGNVFNDWVYRPEDVDPGDPSRLVGLITFSVDAHYLHTLDLDVAEGRGFSQSVDADRNAFLINETAVRQLGWEGNAVGRQIEQYRFTETGVEPAMTGTVVGVLKDFNYMSMHQQIQPLLLRAEQLDRPYVLAVRFQRGQVAAGVERLKTLWHDFTGAPLTQYSFLDSNVDALYRKDQRLGRIFVVFASLAVFIACLGLFGLAAYTAERRTREIGVRKVMGATVVGLVLLLSRDFVRLVLVGFAIATPVAYFGMNQWLERFAYRAGLSGWIFVLSGAAALAVALLTVSYQSIKAARSNPVEALRYE